MDTVEIEQRFATQLGYIRRLHRVGEQVIEAAHSVASSGDESHKLALFMIARATSALHAVEMLFGAGLETDAMAALRIIAELVIDYEWMWKQDRAARIRLFVEHIMIINHRKLARWVNQSGQQTDPALAEKLFAQFGSGHRPPGVDTADKFMQWMEAEYQRLKANYDERKSWAGISIFKRAQECNLGDLYDFHFALGSEAAHSGAATLTGYYAIDNGEVSMVYGPRMPISAWVLGLAATAYGQLIEAVARYMGLTDAQIETKKLADEVLTTFASNTK